MVKNNSLDEQRLKFRPYEVTVLGVIVRCINEEVADKFITELQETLPDKDVIDTANKTPIGFNLDSSSAVNAFYSVYAKNRK